MSIERFVVDSTFLKKAFILWFFVLFPSANFAPVHPGSSEEPMQDLPPSVSKYMKKYGYLPKGTLRSDNQYSLQSENMKDIIKNMQRFGNIPQTGVIDGETLKLMKSPRCGVPDVFPHEDHRRKKRFTFLGSGKGWQFQDMTYYVKKWTKKLDKEAVVDKLERAFYVWSGYAKLNFRQTNDPSADIIVAFERVDHGDSYPFDGKGSALAHAYSPGDSIGGDVHFDDDENWKIGVTVGGEGTDFFSVAVHEFGHSLGLDHSDVNGSIMLPNYQLISPNFQLHEDDILGIRQLYNYQPKVVDTGIKYVPTFVGDFETVEEHREHDISYEIPGPRTGFTVIPYICEGNFDAVSVWRDELLIFKGEYVWRLSEPGKLSSEFPVKVHVMFHGLPSDVTRIDAAYQRKTDGSIVLVTGYQYWIHNGTSLIEGSPLQWQNLDIYVKKIDAAQVWPTDGLTYFYSHDKVWRFNETSRRINPRHSTPMRFWRGVPLDIDAAVSFKGDTYFFKGTSFWKFNNVLNKTEDGYPLPAAQYWLNCPQ